MLTFFRRIRQELLDGGRTSKYILYAIGEIALVVIGILIALQINNWNEWRKDRVEEDKILNEIKSNLKVGANSWQRLSRYDTSAMNSQQIIIKHLSDNLPFHDSLTNHFNTFIDVNHSKIPSSGYQSLNSVGVGILRNDSLRMRITELYDHILPLVDSDFENDVVSRREWMRNTEIYEQFRWRDLAFGDSYEGREAIDYDELINDVTFENLLRSLYYNRRWFNGMRTYAISEMLAIIEMIEIELNQD